MEDENNKLCVVKDKIHDFYWKGKANYVPYAQQAIHNYNEIPDSIKNDPTLEIIDVTSPEGLELLAKEQ